MKVNRKVPTILDVAKASDVSVSTVSRVVNDYKHIRPEIRSRVQNTMKELGYVPNRQARRLVGSRSGVVGLMVQELGSEYIAQVTKGIDEILFENDYDLMLYTTHRHPEKEVSYAQSISSGLADGLLISVPWVANSYLDSLRSADFPHVLVDVDTDDHESCSVGITNWEGTYNAITYLLELNHRRIAIIMDQPGLSVQEKRLAAYKAVLQAHGITFDPALVQRDNFLSPYTGRLVEALLSLADPPTAIFTTGDRAALQVMETLRLKNIPVPQAISVMGFDDIYQANTITPGLTTVYHPMYEMGRAATEILLEQIKTPGLPPRNVRLETRLIIRESCSFRSGG